MPILNQESGIIKERRGIYKFLKPLTLSNVKSSGTVDIAGIAPLRLFLHDGEAIQLTYNFQAPLKVIPGSIRQSTTISTLYSKKIQNVTQ